MKLPPIYTINLDRDVERWHRMKHIMKSAGLLSSVKRFSAIDGKNLNSDQFDEGTTWLARKLQPIGVLGCALSHISLWRKIVDENIPFAIILEDDVELVPNFREVLEKNIQHVFQLYPSLQLCSAEIANANDASVSQVQDVFDVILLGGLGRVHPSGQDSLASRLFSRYVGGRQSLSRKSELLYRPIRPAGTHAYMVSRQGAEKLIKACPKARFHIDIDAWGQPSVDVMMFDPMLAYQSFETSTLLNQSTLDMNSKILPELLRGQVSCLLPNTARDPFTRQTWKHALSEPLLQFGKHGPVLRNDQYIAICSVGMLLAASFKRSNSTTISKAIVQGTAGFAVLVKVLITLLLSSK